MRRALRLSILVTVASLALAGTALAQPIELVNLKGSHPAGQVPEQPIAIVTPAVDPVTTPEVSHSTDPVDVPSQNVSTPGSLGGDSQSVNGECQVVPNPAAPDKALALVCTPGLAATAPRVSGLPVITVTTPGAKLGSVSVNVPSLSTPQADPIPVYTVEPVRTPGASYEVYLAVEFTDQDGTAVIVVTARRNVQAQ